MSPEELYQLADDELRLGIADPALWKRALDEAKGIEAVASRPIGDCGLMELDAERHYWTSWRRVIFSRAFKGASKIPRTAMLG